jgi:hypothetical protein
VCWLNTIGGTPLNETDERYLFTRWMLTYANGLPEFVSAISPSDAVAYRSRVQLPIAVKGVVKRLLIASPPLRGETQ